MFDASGNLLTEVGDDDVTGQDLNIKFSELDPDLTVERDGDVYVCAYTANCTYRQVLLQYCIEVLF